MPHTSEEVGQVASLKVTRPYLAVPLGFPGRPLVAFLASVETFDDLEVAQTYNATSRRPRRLGAGLSAFYVALAGVALDVGPIRRDKDGRPLRPG